MLGLGCACNARGKKKIMTEAEVSEHSSQKELTLLVCPKIQIRPDKGYIYSKRDTKL